jgi:hypothetical protein
MVESYRTLNAGFAIDYHCTHPEVKGCGDDPNRPGKKIMGYVEWSTDEEPVPDWCPLLHQNCQEKIDWLETQLLSDATTSDWAKQYLIEIDRLRGELLESEAYLADLRNKYGKLHTYWQLMGLDGEYKLASYNFEDLKETNAKFVELLKFEGNLACSRECNDCAEQCGQRSFLIKREENK